MLTTLIGCTDDEINHYFRIVETLCDKYNLPPEETLIENIVSCLNECEIDKSFLKWSLNRLFSKYIIGRYEVMHKLGYERHLEGIQDYLSEIDLSDPNVKIDKTSVKRYDLSEELFNKLMDDIISIVNRD